MNSWLNITVESFFFADQIMDKSVLLGSTLVSVGAGGGGSETNTPITSRSQLFRSPKRRSLIATSSSAAAAAAVAATSSPVPIRQRKSSLSFTSPCRSFPGILHP